MYKCVCAAGIMLTDSFMEIGSVNFYRQIDVGNKILFARLICVNGDCRINYRIHK